MTCLSTPCEAATLPTWLAMVVISTPPKSKTMAPACGVATRQSNEAVATWSVPYTGADLSMRCLLLTALTRPPAPSIARMS